MDRKMMEYTFEGLINITKEQFEELGKKEGLNLSSHIYDEILDWVYTYEYVIDIIENKIVISDYQLPEEDVKIYSCKDYVQYWCETWKLKYDYKEGSIDRGFCGDEYINNLQKMINEIESKLN